MRSFLRWLLAFIETRFPEKVTVTNEAYETLVKEVMQVAILQERIGKLEAEVNKFNYAMGFGAKLDGNLKLER